MIHTENRTIERAFLVYARRKRSRNPAIAPDQSEVMKELEDLIASAGAKVVGSHVQIVEAENPATLVGKGTIEHLKGIIEEKGANLVVFQNLLKPKQQALLEDALKVKTLDRREIILDIFAQRARTREGKLQVEFAQLSFRLGRLTGGRKELSRLGGGIGTRGPGEKKLEEDRRKIRQQIRQIERELMTVRKTRSLHYHRRRETGYPVVALVGYTNAGKSTLFNRLTGSQVYVADKLFATLDPTARKFRLPSGREAIIVDTVGFIHDLPAELRQAFLATLEGIGEADLLLHVADGSSDAADSNIDSVEAILSELEFSDKPLLLVLNKRDLCPPKMASDPFGDWQRGQATPGPFMVSAKTGEGLSVLLHEAEKELRLNWPGRTDSTRHAL
ncbi:MAG: GTPase HflX [Syntrophorhabdaceae bacterium]|nr:GTPase HflX [Syntrophorhabdaceae bacterium]